MLPRLRLPRFLDLGSLTLAATTRSKPLGAAALVLAVAATGVAGRAAETNATGAASQNGPGSGEPSHPNAPTAVATYECLGLYWQRASAGECTARFRRAGEATWHDAIPLVYDPRDGEYRGSIVGLTPATAYDVELKVAGDTARVQVQTRSDQFPIGKTTTLPGGDSVNEIVVTDSGTPQEYHLVTVPANGRTTLDAMNHFATNLTIDADYVIVRGVEMRNAATHGILVKAGHHDVVVEDCHITGWGRFAGPVSFGNVGGDQDSAVYAQKGCGAITVQRCLIENPRGAASDWEFGHPVGPQGISFINSTGGNVVRYNEILSTEDHGFNDGFGGSDNFSRQGSPNRDSDIYGNFIRNCWDDAIESEGANMNVRIWGNYLDHFYNGIATACVSRGPIYIFRNVWGISRRTHRNPLGGAAIKTGERGDLGGGRRYVFHNTVVQPGGVETAFSGHVNPNCVTRNNLWDVPGALATKLEKEPASDYDYDLFNGSDKGTAREAHGVRGPVSFLAAPGRLEFFPAPRVTAVHYGKYATDMGGGTTREITDPVVTLPNVSLDRGQRLPDFNDDFVGAAPDLGACELGGKPLEFGRRAYLPADAARAPWELR